MYRIGNNRGITLPELVIVLGIVVSVGVASIGSPVLTALTVMLFVLILVFMGLVNSTLDGIYVAAVYRYASEGEASGFFSEEMVKGAFRPK